MKRQTILNVIEKAARIKMEQDLHHRAPVCAGIFHQPKRPVTKKR